MENKIVIQPTLRQMEVGAEVQFPIESMLSVYNCASRLKRIRVGEYTTRTDADHIYVKRLK